MTDPTTTPTLDQLRARLDRHTSALGHLTGGSWRAITRAHDTITATTDQVVELLGDYQLSSDLSVLETRAGWLQATLGEEAIAGRPCYQTGRELIHVLAQIAGMARIALDAAAPPPIDGGEPTEIDDLLIAGQEWANAHIPTTPAADQLRAAGQPQTTAASTTPSTGLGRGCEVGSCPNQATTVVRSCDTVYVCTPCATIINAIATQDLAVTA